MAQIIREGVGVDFGRQNSVAVNTDAPGYVNPDSNKFAGTSGRVGGNTEIGEPRNNGLLRSLGAFASEQGARMMNTAAEEAYLSGQADAAAGKSKEELESNIVTRRWATAGWADTKSRLSVADADAQTAVDMKKLREQDPERMKEYLQQRRESLMPLMKDMSMEARKGMMAQMALSDQHAIAKHMSEHSKFIVDQQVKGVQTSFSVAQDAMNASKGDEVAYGAATNAAMSNIWGNIVSNPNLPEDTKLKLIEEAAGLALSNDNLQLYEKMRDLKDPKGNTLLTNLPFDSQSKLAKQYQAAYKDAGNMRNSAFMAQAGLYESNLSDPTAKPISWEDHMAFVAEGVQRGVFSQEKQASLSKAWADGNAKKQKSVNLAGMYASGDINGMFSVGGTEEEGVDAYVALQQRNGRTPGQVAADLAQIGLSTGQATAFTRVGKLMRSSISMIGTGVDIDPGQLAAVNSVMDVVDRADKGGNRMAKTSFLSSFDSDTQDRLLTFRAGMTEGMTSTVAAQNASTKSADNAALTPAAKAALAAKHGTAAADMIAKIEPKGLFAQAWEKVVPNMFRSDANVAADKLSASRNGMIGWRDNKELVEAAQHRSKVELMLEFDDIARNSPYLSSEDITTKALTRVAARTLVTDGGPVVMPKGQTVQSFFGVDASVSPDVVSSALNVMHKPSKGNRTVYVVGADGRMQWTERNSDTNALVKQGEVFDPRQVNAVVRQEQDRMTEEFVKTDGAGTRANGKDGASVRYNGDNTLGIGTNVMYQFRSDLVKHEGVTNKPYSDGSGGRKSVGVGVNSINKHYPPIQADGTVLPSDINRSFRAASDDAMRTGNEYVQDLPRDRQNTYATRLYGSLSYQGGSVDKSVRDAFQTGTQAEALAALKGSRQYKASPESRQRYYEDMLTRMIPRNNF